MSSRIPSNYAQQPYSSPNTVLAICRQKKQGYYNTPSIFTTLLGTQFTPLLSGGTSSLGTEIGSTSISDQGAQKETFSPSASMSGHMRVGALMNFMAAMGYKVISQGKPASPSFTTTLASDSIRQRHNIIMTSATGLGIGDLVQIGTTSGSIASRSDNTEVFRVIDTFIGAQIATWKIKIYGAPTGGTFQVMVYGYTNPTVPATYYAYRTVALAWDASPAVVQAALEAIPVIGVGNVIVSTLVDTDSLPYYFVVANGTLSGSYIPFEMEGDGSGLTGGIGFGANIGLAGQNDSWVHVQMTAEGYPASTVALDGAMNYHHANGEPVVKIDPLKEITHDWFHVNPDDEMDNDGFSLFVKLPNVNPEDVYRLMYIDGKASRFDVSFQVGGIAKFNLEMKFKDVYIPTIDPVMVNDPSSVTLNNTRGEFEMLGERHTGPRSVNITMASDIPDDFTLFHYKPQALTHTSHMLNMTTESNFVRKMDKAINYNGSEITPSDIMPESGLKFRFLSQVRASSVEQIYHEFSIYASDVQFGQYSPNIDTNQLVTGTIGTIAIKTYQGGQERWRIRTVTSSGVTNSTYGAR